MDVRTQQYPCDGDWTVARAALHLTRSQEARERSRFTVVCLLYIAGFCAATGGEETAKKVSNTASRYMHASRSWATEPSLQGVIVPWTIEPSPKWVLMYWAIEPSLQGVLV